MPLRYPIPLNQKFGRRGHLSYDVFYYCKGDHQLKKNGTPIPTNDIWIAAVTFQQGLQLYTLDSHFAYVEGLLLR